MVKVAISKFNNVIRSFSFVHPNDVILHIWHIMHPCAIVLSCPNCWHLIHRWNLRFLRRSRYGKWTSLCIHRNFSYGCCTPSGGHGIVDFFMINKRLIIILYTYEFYMENINMLYIFVHAATYKYLYNHVLILRSNDSSSVSDGSWFGFISGYIYLYLFLMYQKYMLLIHLGRFSVF